MFQLRVQSPNLRDLSVVLLKSTSQIYSVVCGLWPAMGGLETTVNIGTILYAYASTYTGDFHDGVKISPDAISSSLSPGNVYLFNGSQFVQERLLPPDSVYVYGLQNGRLSSSPLTCGLCQDVTINGEAELPPVCVRSLLPNWTKYFPPNDQFYLGLGQFPDFSDPGPGLLILTSLLQGPSPMGSIKSRRPQDLALGPFALVDFSLSLNLVAIYQQTSGSFQIEPRAGEQGEPVDASASEVDAAFRETRKKDDPIHADMKKEKRNV